MIVCQLIVYVHPLFNTCQSAVSHLWKEVGILRTFADILGATDTISKMFFSTLWIFFMIELWHILPNPTLAQSRLCLTFVEH